VIFIPPTITSPIILVSQPSRRLKMDEVASVHLSEPLDLVKLALGEYVFISSLFSLVVKLI